MPTWNATLRLSPRRRNVLCLRAAGWSQAQIAERLGMTERLVRKDCEAINRLLIPGVTDDDMSAKGYRAVYVLGLIDGGVDPDDVDAHLSALVDRVEMRLAQEAADSPRPGGAEVRHTGSS